MSLSKGYSLHSEISDVNSEIIENDSSFKTTKAAQNFLTVATTLIYYSFTSVIFAGVSVWAFQDYAFANATNINGLLFTVALVISAPIGLALAKHSNFQAMAKAPDLRAFIIRALILLAILTGIWYEAISSSSNLQEKAFHAVEHSKVGDSIMNSSVTITAGENGELAKASFKLVSCQRKLKEGKVKDCDNSQSAVDTLKEQASLTRDTVAKANVEAISAKQAAMDKERDSHALPAAKAFSGWFDTSLAAGTFIIVIISSLFFELIHLSTVYSERNNLLKQADLRFTLKNLKTEYFNLVGKTYSPDDFKDDQVLDLAEMRENNAMHDFKTGIQDRTETVMDENPEYKITTRGKPYKAPNPGFGFVPSPANKFFKWQDEPQLPAKAEKPAFGFVPSRKSGESLDAENRRKYPQQIVWPTNDRPTPDDYGLVPRIDRNHPSPTTGTEAKTPTGTAAFRPLEQTVYTVLEQSGAGSVKQPLGTSGTVGNGDTGTPADRAAFEAHDNLYPQWRAEIKRGEIAATARACRNFVAKHRGVDVLSMRQAKYIWGEWGRRAVGENVLSLNPEYLPGNRKLKYLKVA